MDVRDLNRRTENQQQGTAKSKGELPRVPHVIFCLLIVHHSYYNLHHGPGSGRVPQVRQSVPGPKTVFFQCCHSTYQGSRSGPLPFARRVGTVEGAAPHLFRPMYAQATRISCTWLHPATACAAFSKESRMSSPTPPSSTGNPGEHGAPVLGSGLCCWHRERCDRTRYTTL